MSLLDVISIASTIILSFGGSGVIIIACSSWLGKLWANRIMESEKAEHQKALEKLRNKLEEESSRNLESLKADLEIFKEQHLKGFHEKIEIYRMVIDVIADFIGEMDIRNHEEKGIEPDRVDSFNRKRLKAYGYLVMIAPQSVMDANDNLTDHLIKVFNGSEPYEWPKIRGFGLELLNQIRLDLNFQKNEVTYNGEL